MNDETLDLANKIKTEISQVEAVLSSIGRSVTCDIRPLSTELKEKVKDLLEHEKEMMEKQFEAL